MQPSSGKSRLRPWRSDCRQVGLVEVYKRIKGAGVHLGHLIVSEVKEPEALEAREHAAVEGGNLVVPEEKLVHFGGAGKRALLNRGDAVVAEPHQGEAGAVGMDMVPTTSTPNQWTRRLVIAVRGVAVIVLVRSQLNFGHILRTSLEATPLQHSSLLHIMARIRHNLLVPASDFLLALYRSALYLDHAGWPLGGQLLSAFLYSHQVCNQGARRSHEVPTGN